MIIETCTDTDCPDCTGHWWTGEVGSSVHVVPVGDISVHHSSACPCRPVREMQVHDCDGVGSMDWMIIHNSFDGREADE